MTFLAHWKLGGGPGAAMDGQSAVDSAAGGSGAHDGTYHLATSESMVSTLGYDENLSMRGASSSGDGVVDSIANISDLQLTGTYTLMSWFMPGNRLANDMYIMNVGALGATEASNHLVFVEVITTGAVRMYWEYGAGNSVDIYSIAGLISVVRWHHIAVVRYPIAANYGVKFYIDGVLADTQDNGGSGYTAPSGGTSAIGYIGRAADDGSSANYYHLDSIRLYDTDESANVATVYNAEKSSFDGAAVATVQLTPEIIQDEAVVPKARLSVPFEVVQESPAPYVDGMAHTGPALLLGEHENAGFHR